MFLRIRRFPRKCLFGWLIVILIFFPQIAQIGALDTRCWKSTITYGEFLSILMNKIVINHTMTIEKKRTIGKERKKDWRRRRIFFAEFSLFPQLMKNLFIHFQLQNYVNTMLWVLSSLHTRIRVTPSIYRFRLAYSLSQSPKL